MFPFTPPHLGGENLWWMGSAAASSCATEISRPRAAGNLVLCHGKRCSPSTRGSVDGCGGDEQLKSKTRVGAPAFPLATPVASNPRRHQSTESVDGVLWTDAQAGGKHAAVHNVDVVDVVQTQIVRSHHALVCLSHRASAHLVRGKHRGLAGFPRHAVDAGDVGFRVNGQWRIVASLADP